MFFRGTPVAYMSDMRPYRTFFGLAAVLGLALAPLSTGCASEGAEDDADSGDAEIRAGDPSELLAQGFDVWKQRFAARAATWRTIEPSTEVGRLPVPSTEDAGLGIDYVYIPAKSRPRNLVVMSSGIHGVEAPAGVVFQDVLLGECATGDAIDRSETAILVLHVLNPYGAKYGRRFNGNNVDLNRNFFDAKTNAGDAFAGKHIVNQEYRDVRHLLEGGRISIIDILAAWLRHGEATMTKALSGQYEFPQGIYWGGGEVQHEAVALQELLGRIAEPFANLALLDVHTGLGKSGINQIMTNPVPAGSGADVKAAYAREVKLLGEMFPAAECNGLCEVQLPEEHGFLTTGDITQWPHERFAKKRVEGTVVSVTSEIGTSSAREVLEGLVDENYCHFARTSSSCGEEQYQRDVKRLRGLFNPSDIKWKGQVVRAARQMCTAIGRFSRLK